MRSSKVAVIIATFGAREWELAGNLAAQKVRNQTVESIVLHHHLNEATLSEARNSAVEWFSESIAFDEVGWLVFLDATDELDSRFVEVLTSYQGNADVLQTSVRGFNWNLERKDWIESGPVFYPQKFPLIRQNYLIIGSPVRRETFLDVGGFDDYPVLEDWAFWLKCEKAGAIFGVLPAAVYEINNFHERNKNINADVIAREIRAKYR